MFESYDNVYNFWFENGASSVTFLEHDDGLIAFKKIKKSFFYSFSP